MKKPELKTAQHCSEDVITAYLLGMAERRDCNHIDSCLDCYVRVERARIQMRELHATADKLASRPEQFWARQREAIMDRVAATKPGWAYRWVWASGAVVAALALVLVLFLSTGKVNRPSPETTGIRDREDDILLTEIESDLQRPVPRALEPASLLVRARNDVARASQRHTTGGTQE